MAYLRGLLALNLSPVDRVPTLGLVNSNVIKEVYGKESFDLIEAYKLLDVDFTYTHGVKEKIKPRRKRKVGIGTFDYFKDDFPYTDLFPIAYKGLILSSTYTSDQLWVVSRPFKNYDELLKYLKEKFNPVEWEYRTLTDLINNYRYSYRRLQDPLRDVTLVAGEIYLTLFTFFLVHLGHKFTLLLLMRNPEIFEEAAKKYVPLVKMHIRAWTEVGIKAFVAHDDIAMRDRPMISPEIFEDYIASFYPYVWEPLKVRSIKIIFVSDGKYLPLMDVLIKAGVSGFKINWDARLSRREMEQVINEYGDKYVLSFGPRYEVMMYGSLKDAKDEAKWLAELVRDVKGFFISNVVGEPKNVVAFWKAWIKERERR